MPQCSFRPAVYFHVGEPVKYGDRCKASAEVRILSPDGKDVPGCWYCRPHAQEIIDEYTEKLHETWTMRELTALERY